MEIASDLENLAAAWAGRTITSIAHVDDMLVIGLGGTTLEISDHGQSCCEHRYMKPPNDIDTYVGDKLVAVYVKPTRGGLRWEGDYGDVREIEFLEVVTSRGGFVVPNYNEHNGYYGGFCLRIEERSNGVRRV